MNRFQTSKRKTLMSLVAVAFTMLAGCSRPRPAMLTRARR